MLTTCECWSCCWTVLMWSQGPFSFWCCLTSKGLEVHGRWDGVEPEQLTQNGKRDILYHDVSCSAVKAGISWSGWEGCHCLKIGWASFSRWRVIELCITCFLYYFSWFFFSYGTALIPTQKFLLFSILSYSTSIGSGAAMKCLDACWVKSQLLILINSHISSFLFGVMVLGKSLRSEWED